MKMFAGAVDLGATNVRVALISKEGTIVAKISRETPRTGKNGRVIAEVINTMLTELCDRNLKGHLRGIGIASLGPLDYMRGGPTKPPNLPYAFIPLVKPLQERFSVPVILHNDCNAAVLGEQRFGAGKKKKNVVYITISTGIGAGAIVDGRLLLGRSGNAGEIGHTVVDTKYNLECTCGTGIGHWEGYASGRNISRFFRTWSKKNGIDTRTAFSDTKDIFACAREGDATALRFLDELTTINARGVSNAIVAYDPDVITIGGSVLLNNKSLMLHAMKRKINHYLKMPEIRVTPLGHDAGLLGAAAAIFSE